MRILSPGKINLHLRVAPRRGDGFHPLMSWMCSVGLADEMTIEPSNAAGIWLTSNRQDVPTDGRNLVVKVAEALGADAGITPSLRIDLHKRIPIGAGLGGGSSNGAFALLALNELWKARRTSEQLAALAAKFGSDLSFFFHAPSAVCTGRGEIVRPIPAPKPRAALLIFPPFPMPTAEVYRRFDEMKLGSAEEVKHQPDWTEWSGLQADALLGRLVNDLETPAFAARPALRKLRGDLEQSLGRVVRMTGSGSTLFTIFDRFQEAEEESARMRTRFGVQTEATELCPVLVRIPA